MMTRSYPPFLLIVQWYSACCERLPGSWLFSTCCVSKHVMVTRRVAEMRCRHICIACVCRQKINLCAYILSGSSNKSWGDNVSREQPSTFDDSSLLSLYHATCIRQHVSSETGLWTNREALSAGSWGGDATRGVFIKILGFLFACNYMCMLIHLFCDSICVAFADKRCE